MASDCQALGLIRRLFNNNPSLDCSLFSALCAGILILCVLTISDGHELCLVHKVEILTELRM